MSKAQNAFSLLEVLGMHVAVVTVQNENGFAHLGNTYRGTINIVAHKLGAIDRVLSKNPMVVFKIKKLGVDIVSCRKGRSRRTELERFPERIIEDTIRRVKHHCVWSAVFFGEVLGDFGEDRHLNSFG